MRLASALTDPRVSQAEGAVMRVRPDESLRAGGAFGRMTASTRPRAGRGDCASRRRGRRALPRPRACSRARRTGRAPTRRSEHSHHLRRAARRPGRPSHTQFGRQRNSGFGSDVTLRVYGSGWRSGRTLRRRHALTPEAGCAPGRGWSTRSGALQLRRSVERERRISPREPPNAVSGRWKRTHFPFSRSASRAAFLFSGVHHDPVPLDGSEVLGGRQVDGRPGTATVTSRSSFSLSTSSGAGWKSSQVRNSLTESRPLAAIRAKSLATSVWSKSAHQPIAVRAGQ